MLEPGPHLLVHDAPVYPTTRVVEQMGLTLITVDFNDLSALKQVVDEQQPDAALVRRPRQQPRHATCWRECAGNVARGRCSSVNQMTGSAVMKVARIGCECGANVSTFSCFKLFQPGCWCSGRRC
ncbi:hypothetical protein ACLB1S_28020 [Escherichia coli]